jgi:proteasome lid subunit RPN8/RPN11
MLKKILLKAQVNSLIQEAILFADKNGQEICGLIIDNGYFLELIQTRNKVRNGGGFAFYSSEIKAIQKSVNILYHEIVGTFHSHPSYIAEPGKSDIENTLDDSLMLIIDVTNRDFGLWYIKNYEKQKVDFELI